MPARRKPRWAANLVEAFPVPEDRQEGYKKKKQRYETEDAPTNVLSDQSGKTIEQALSNLSLSDHQQKPVKSSIPEEPFRFLDLPSELRNRIYRSVLFSPNDYDGSRIGCLLANKQLHVEASHILYSYTRFPLFQLQQFDNTVPTLDRLRSTYYSSVTNLLLSLGQSWTKVPKAWKVTGDLTQILKDLVALKTLRVFVEFDPSLPAFKTHRKSDTYYTDFCGDLLGDVLEAIPQCQYVEFDGNKSVNVNGPLVSRLRQEAVEAGKEVKWGLMADWAHLVDKPHLSEKVVEQISREAVIYREGIAYSLK